MVNHSDLAKLIWQIADLLRGPYRPPQYERVMLPVVVLRQPGTVRTMLDPAWGTRGMLAEAQSYMRRHNAGRSSMSTARTTTSARLPRQRPTCS
jgi:type I restriction-modification system DNA methylase subunit